MSAERAVENYLIDMDGVLVWEERMIPGADRFIAALPYRPSLIVDSVADLVGAVESDHFMRSSSVRRPVPT